MTVYFAATAEAGLVEIAEWIAANDPRRAVTFVLELRAVCLAIGTFPRKGRVIRRKGQRVIRRWMYRDYLIFYEASDDDVIIHIVVHGSRNIRRILQHWRRDEP